jgi:CHAT domain-containing protein
MAILLEDGNLTPVPFDLTEADLESLLIVADGGTLIGGYLSVQFSAGNREETLNHVLDTLGSKMMAPISAHMGILPEKADAAISRTVILIPTGRLSLLPLHAVPWRANGGSRILLDYFNVAFVPSLRSLSHCLEALNSCSATGMKFCAVGNPLPLPDGYASLEFARAEVEEISRNFADSALFCEETAVLPAVEECLDQGMYLHFSCHGEFDPNDPMLSGILLSGGRFTLRKLVTRPELKKARLVVLSACQTAITEFNRLPEEVIGLPSGFIQAGASGVVGSLWPVNDISTALLMIKFYQYHLAGDPLNSIPPLSPVSALRKAQLWLRDLTNADLADLFDEYRKAAAKRQGGMPQDLAQSQFRAHALNPPGEHPYSQPYYWAAFAFFGM